MNLPSVTPKTSRHTADSRGGRGQTNQRNRDVYPTLDAIKIEGKDITADALLTQRKIADYRVARGAHYHFTVKGNQPTLKTDIALLFDGARCA